MLNDLDREIDAYLGNKIVLPDYSKGYLYYCEKYIILNSAPILRILKNHCRLVVTEEYGFKRNRDLDIEIGAPLFKVYDRYTTLDIINVRIKRRKTFNKMNDYLLDLDNHVPDVSFCSYLPNSIAKYDNSRERFLHLVKKAQQIQREEPQEGIQYMSPYACKFCKYANCPHKKENVIWKKLFKEERSDV